MSQRDPTVIREPQVMPGYILVFLVLGFAVLLVGTGVAMHWSELKTELASRMETQTEIDESVDFNALESDYFTAIDNGDAKVAFQLAERYVAAAPGSSYGYVQRGYVHWWLSRFDEAITDMNRALSLSPDYGYAYYVRSSCRFALGELDAADRDAEAALLRAADEGEIFQAYVLQVWLAYAQQRYAEARVAFENAQAHGGGADLPVAADWLAHLRDGVAFRGALVAPEGAAWQARLALAVYAGRRPLAELEAAAATNGLAAFYLAQFALVEGRHDDAVRLLRRYVNKDWTADPEFAVARTQLGLL